jgi:hypothetical protein
VQRFQPCGLLRGRKPAVALRLPLAVPCQAFGLAMAQLKPRAKRPGWGAGVLPRVESRLAGTEPVDRVRSILPRSGRSGGSHAALRKFSLRPSVAARVPAGRLSQEASGRFS